MTPVATLHVNATVPLSMAVGSRSLVEETDVSSWRMERDTERVETGVVRPPTQLALGLVGVDDQGLACSLYPLGDRGDEPRAGSSRE